MSEPLPEHAAQQAGARSPADTQPLKLPGAVKDLITSRSTGKFTTQEILARLEAGRVELDRTEEGSALRTAHVQAPPEERRAPGRAPDLPGGFPERRAFAPLLVPTRFPATGPILLLVLGGFADDRAMGEEVPYWRDDAGGTLLWQALARAGLLAPPGDEAALGKDGAWAERPPDTRSLALTYLGFRRQGEAADLEQVIKPWNLRRMQVLVQACDERSQGRLKVVALGEAARFVAAATLFAQPGIPLHALPDPAEASAAEGRERWVDLAARLLGAGVG